MIFFSLFFSVYIYSLGKINIKSKRNGKRRESGYKITHIFIIIYYHFLHFLLYFDFIYLLCISIALIMLTNLLLLEDDTLHSKSVRVNGKQANVIYTIGVWKTQLRFRRSLPRIRARAIRLRLSEAVGK